MRKNILNSLLALAVFAVVACSPKRQIVKAPEARVDTTLATKDTKAENLSRLKANNLNYTTLSLKAKADLNIAGNENNVNLNIRIQKDAKIWFSVTALGGAIEAARGIITPDSILLMNRLQKTVLRKPLSYIYSYTNKQVNYTWLQAILSGNTVNDLLVDKSDLKNENGVWQLQGVEQGLAYHLLFNTLQKSKVLNLNDARNGQALKVAYDAYTPLNQGLFPTRMQINSVAGNKNIDVSLEFTKIEANQGLDFPFSVPRSYERIN